MRGAAPGVDSGLVGLDSLPRTHLLRSDRAASIAYLLIAATAELAQLTVVHVDPDFELIAEPTGSASNASPDLSRPVGKRTSHFVFARSFRRPFL